MFEGVFGAEDKLSIYKLSLMCLTNATLLKTRSAALPDSVPHFVFLTRASHMYLSVRMPPHISKQK
jgi:hypothetical protein